MTQRPPLQDPSDPFAPPFEEKGYTFEAFMPRSDAERTVFRLLVRRGKDVLFTVEVPMLYAPRFGVDMGDRAALEDATDRLIRALPAAADFTPDALDVFRAEDAARTGMTVQGLNVPRAAP